MTSREKFLIIRNITIYKTRDYKLGTTYRELKTGKAFEINEALDEIEKDLDRLEKQDKALEIAKNKGIDISLVKRFIQVKFYNCCVVYGQKLSQEEWDLLKEVFG